MIAFIAALTMAGVAGMEFFYLLYLESVIKQHKRRIAELERHCNSILHLLHETEEKPGEIHTLRHQEFFLEEVIEEKEEVWPETIDDDPHR
jgi:16S rRNA C1402 (ribose-2'-O) methylase RsmI